MRIDARQRNESHAVWRTSNLPQRYVYFVGPIEGSTVKIGTAYEPCDRLRELQTGNPERLSFLAVTEGGSETERAYHARFAAQRIRGEWFRRTPAMDREMQALLKAFYRRNLVAERAA